MEMSLPVSNDEAMGDAVVSQGGMMKLMVVGHRGCGMNVMESPDTRRRWFRENSLASFAAASSLPHLHFLEFDVQVTKDDCPVIFHDNFILTQAQGRVVEKRVTELTLNEFLSYGPQKQSAKEGKPLLKKTNEGRVVEWKVEKEDGVCTLEEVFEKVRQSVGFDVELKFDDSIVYKEEELRHTLEAVLNVVGKHAEKRRRPLIFSSFHPDASRLIRQMQDAYPVFFITKGGTQVFKDPRRNSLEEAVTHCKSAGLQGVVSEVKAIFKHPGMAANIKDCNLALFTYGQLNNVPEAVYLQHLMGVDGVIIDFVQDITKALVSGFLDAEKINNTSLTDESDGIRKEASEEHKPEFSHTQLSFLLNLIPGLMQT